MKAKTRHFPIIDFGGRGDLNVPFNLSKIVVRTLAYRCIRICSSPRLLQSTLDDLKRILLLNGYPMGTVKYHMNDVIEKHQNKPKAPGGGGGGLPYGTEGDARRKF